MPDVDYAGFNLLLLSPSSKNGPLTFNAEFVTNHGSGGKNVSRLLTSAERLYGGLSNGIEGQGAENWNKIVLGIKSFKGAIELTSPDTADESLAEELFKILT